MALGDILPPDGVVGLSSRRGVHGERDPGESQRIRSRHDAQRDMHDVAFRLRIDELDLRKTRRTGGGDDSLVGIELREIDQELVTGPLLQTTERVPILSRHDAARKHDGRLVAKKMSTSGQSSRSVSISQ